METDVDLSNKDFSLVHLVRISWLQVALFFVGVLSWIFYSLRASLVFMLTGLASMLFWHIHLWLVSRVLTHNIKWRFVFGFLIILKLALLALILRGIIYYFPMEAVPLVTGTMLFSVPIIIEAIYLTFQSGPDGHC
jgi:hypothetical protein